MPTSCSFGVVEVLKAVLSETVTEQMVGYSVFAVRLARVFIKYATPEADTIACRHVIDANFKQDVIGPVAGMSPTMRLDSVC